MSATSAQAGPAKFWLKKLPNPSGYSSCFPAYLNDSGDVLVNCNDSNWTSYAAFTINLKSSIQKRIIVPKGYVMKGGTHINNLGQVTGLVTNNTDKVVRMFYIRPGSMKAIVADVDLGTDNDFSNVLGISDQGIVWGMLPVWFPNGGAFTFNTNTKSVIRYEISGFPSSMSINSSGRIVLSALSPKSAPPSTYIYDLYDGAVGDLTLSLAATDQPYYSAIIDDKNLIHFNFQSADERYTPFIFDRQSGKRAFIRQDFLSDGLIETSVTNGDYNGGNIYYRDLNGRFGPPSYIYKNKAYEMRSDIMNLSPDYLLEGIASANAKGQMALVNARGPNDPRGVWNAHVVCPTENCQ